MTGFCGTTFSCHTGSLRSARGWLSLPLRFMYPLIPLAFATTVLTGCGSNLWVDAEIGNIEAVRHRIEAGADVNALDGLDKSPLYYATHNGSVEIVRLLLENGANVNTKYERNRTALHLAAEKGYPEIARLLLVNRAKVNALDNNGGSPLDWAEGTFHEQTATLLRRHGGKTGTALKRKP